MKFLKYLSITAIAVIMCSCAGETAKVAGIDYENMDLTVKPGDDFAQYATGRWSARNPQPPEYPMWGVVTKVSDDNTKILAELIQEIAAKQNKKGSIEQKIGDLYNMMMDSTRLNAEGNAPIKAEIAKIDAISTREEFLHYCATEHDNILFGLGVGPDAKDSKKNIVSIGQGGLSLGNRDYYLSDDPQTVAIREAMKQHMVNMFMLTDYSEAESVDMMNRIWAIESEIAVPYFSQEQQRDPEANYHKMTVDELEALCKGFDWKTYLKDYRYDKTTEVDCEQVEPVVKACEILMNAPLEDLKAIYRWDVINGFANVVSDAYADENFNFQHIVYGTQEKAPRWKKAEGLVDNYMSDALAQMFVKKYFPEKAKTEMLDLIEELKTSLGNRIQAQDWMSEKTKATALDKLAAYSVKVGYPDKWDDLSGLEIDPEKSLMENLIEASKFYWNLNYDKKYNKPVDADEWQMPAHMVNAYYNPTTNEICFPAGFLQPPLFDLNADAAANFGAIGVVIGHEMTHGFDDQGRQFDKEGNLNDWWAPEDAEAFQVPCQKMVDYFSSLWVIPGELKANGALCLGENIADHGGLNVAYDAFKNWQSKHGALPVDNGFTPEQRFFLSYATVWAGSASDEILRYLTMMDVHSVDKLRVNGGLAQCDGWYEAFNIQPGDALYVAPEDRVRIW